MMLNTFKFPLVFASFLNTLYTQLQQNRKKALRQRIQYFKLYFPPFLHYHDLTF